MTPCHIRVRFRDVMGRLAVCAVLLVSAVGQQQEMPNEQLQREAMKNFQWLVGKWSGEGQWFTVNGTLLVTVTEDIHYEQNGHVLKIDEREINKADHKPVGFSIVAISYDEKTGVYRVHGGLPKSRDMEGKLGIDPDWRGMTIQFERPKLATREVMRLNEQGEWSEVHWVAPEGETPWVFMQLTVRREKEPHPVNGRP